MSEVSKWTDEVLTAAIIIATIGITVGIGILITNQFENIKVGNTTVAIPQQFKLPTYTPMIGLMLTILVIMLVVGIVFGFVIPKLRAGVRGGV
ncbi:MAG: hypothetical protein QXT64_06705 [Desulfurococcaceae archaeon]